MTACTSQNDTGNARDTISRNEDKVPLNKVICFQKLEGTEGQDTTFLKLIIEEEQVSGEYTHYPHEKDRRVGTITATKKDELIKGLWIYMQEGINDTLQVEFKLSGDKLVQKIIP